MQSAECILRLYGKLKGMNNGVSNEKKDMREKKQSFFERNSAFIIHHSALSPHGGVAQLGEHLPCKQGVMGSNPIISTKKFRTAKFFNSSLFTIHSSFFTEQSERKGK